MRREDPTYRRLAASYEFPDGSKPVYCYARSQDRGDKPLPELPRARWGGSMDVWWRITQLEAPAHHQWRLAFASNSRRLLAGAPTSRPLAPLRRRAATSPTHVHGHRPPRPGRRVRSLYDYLVVGDAPDTPGRVGNHQRRWVAGGFDQFLERVPDRDLLNQIATFSSRLDVSEAVDRIAGMLERLVHQVLRRRTGHARSPARVAARGASGPCRRHTVAAHRRTGGEAPARLEPEYELLRRSGRRWTGRRPATT